MYLVYRLHQDLDWLAGQVPEPDRQTVHVYESVIKQLPNLNDICFGHGLLQELKAAGLTVPADVLDRWVEHLNQTVPHWASVCSTATIKQLAEEELFEDVSWAEALAVSATANRESLYDLLDDSEDDWPDWSLLPADIPTKQLKIYARQIDQICENLSFYEAHGGLTPLWGLSQVVEELLPEVCDTALSQWRWLIAPQSRPSPSTTDSGRFPASFSALTCARHQYRS